MKSQPVCIPFPNRRITGKPGSSLNNIGLRDINENIKRIRVERSVFIGCRCADGVFAGSRKYMSGLRRISFNGRLGTIAPVDCPVLNGIVARIVTGQIQLIDGIGQNNGFPGDRQIRSRVANKELPLHSDFNDLRCSATSASAAAFMTSEIIVMFENTRVSFIKSCGIGITHH